ITITAATVETTGGNITLQAADNVVIGAAPNGDSTLHATTGSITINAAGNFTLNSGSNVSATAGSVAITAGGNFTLNSNSTILAGTTINIAASGSTIDIFGALSSTTNNISDGNSNNVILLQNMTLSGTTNVYDGSGQDTITVNQPESITNGDLNLDGGTGNTSYTVDYTGSNNYVINVNASAPSMTPVTLTSTGSGSSQTLSPAVADQSFNASSDVNLSNSTITVSTDEYQTGDVVRYDYGTTATGAPTSIGGLNNGELYYVVVTGPNTIQLASTLADALEANPVIVAFTGLGSSNTQTLQAVVETLPFNAAQAVNTTANTLSIASNGYLNGERVVYNDGGGTAIGGLTNGATYYVIVVDANTIELSSTAPTAGSTLTINGTNNADNILMRANTTGSAFVADLDANSNVERVNYTGAISDLVVNTLGGNDTVTMDDNLTYTLVQGSGGNDTFQVGQVFQSLRDAAAGVAAGDQFATTLTSQGYLSNGISFETTILGGTGNDLFTVYHN
ncbi:MAG: hypothetical protein WAK26_09905, partial [Terracidiphilus sp.]